MFFAYHGTQSQNVQSICCDGWNISKRGKNGQAHGQGEYFGKSIWTAERYSENGYIILSLLVTKYARYVSTRDLGEIYVVDNTASNTYCLPVAIIEDRIRLYSFNCLHTKFSIPFRCPSMIRVDCGGGEVIEYNYSMMETVRNNHSRGNYVFNVRALP